MVKLTIKLAIRLLKSRTGRRMVVRVLRALMWVLRTVLRVLKGAILGRLAIEVLKSKTGRRLVRRVYRRRRLRRVVGRLIWKQLFGR